MNEKKLIGKKITIEQKVIITLNCMLRGLNSIIKI